MRTTFHSWIPNLSGHLNFEYLTDNIAHEDNDYKIYQYKIADTVKYFYINDIDFSDNIESNYKGIKKSVLIRIEKNKDEFLGMYCELSSENVFSQFEDSNFPLYNYSKLASTKEYILTNELDFLMDNEWLSNSLDILLLGDFKIELNGDIEFSIKKNNLLETSENIPLLVYRTIKYIIHKDIFHSVEEDRIIDVYIESNRNLIMKSMLNYIKGIERLIKDQIDDYYIKSDFFELILVRAEGILKYMYSYQSIHRLDQDDECKKHIKLSENILNVIRNSLNVKAKELGNLSISKDIKIIAVTATISSSIFISSIIKNDNKLDISLYSILYAFGIFFLMFFIFDRHTMRKLVMSRYYNQAYKNPEKFIAKRLSGDGRKLHKSIILITSLGVFLAIGYLMYLNNIFTSLIYHLSTIIF